MAQRRQSEREDVIAWHLARVRALRDAVADRLGRLPGLELRTELLRRDQDLAAAERGFAVLLPELWELGERPPRRPAPAAEIKVLGEARSSAAVVVMRLERRTDALLSGEERDLAAARALFRYCTTALGALGFDDPVGPVLGGTPIEPLG